MATATRGQRRARLVGDCQACDAPGALRLVRVEPFQARYTAPEDLQPREEPAQHGYARCMHCGTEHECIRPEDARWGDRFPGETGFDDREWVTG